MMNDLQFDSSPTPRDRIAMRRAVHHHTAVALCLGTLLTTGGCLDQDPCTNPTTPGVTIVLTFDDGPLAADVELFHNPAPDALLVPLNSILETLNARRIQAVFFIEGPGETSNALQYRDAFADGLAAMHADGHVLGYHAFRHDPAIWTPPPTPPQLAQLAIRTDLDQLELYLGLLLAERGLSPTEVLTPIFRQPYGGGGLSRTPAVAVAAARGWTYRGFMIDSVDWTDHADAPAALVAHLPIAAEADRVQFVRGRLRAGAIRNTDRAVVDVLLHVNSFTATHLEDWIDELTIAFESLERGPVTYGVPVCYRDTSDVGVDLSVVFGD